MLLIQLKRFRKEGDFDIFYKNIKSVVPTLYNFTNAKINIAERQGLIEKNFYNANGILDEVYLEIFDKILDITDEKMLKTFLFSKTIQKINEKAKIEGRFNNSINIDTIVKEELNLLKEKYTTDAAGDFILDEELDDISYKQDDFKPIHYLLDDDTSIQIFNTTPIENITSNDKIKNWVSIIFNNLPTYSQSIAELYVFANQNAEEISKILNINKEQVDRAIVKITKIMKLK